MSMIPSKRISRIVMAFAVLFAFVGGSQRAGLAQVPDVASGLGCWSIVPTPSINAQSSEITAMSASGADNVWVVGRSVTAAKADTFAMRYNGSGWQITPTRAISEAYVLEDIAAVAPDNVWAVGSFSYSVPTPGYEKGKLILHWDGKAWKVSLKGNVGEMRGVWATGTDDVWAVGRTTRGDGSSVAVVHHWNGQAWSETPIGTPFLNDVMALAADDVWVVGSAVYHWDGRQWAISKPDTKAKYGVWEVGASDVWAVGDGEVGAEALHWNGQEWNGFPTVADNNAKLQAVAGLSTSDIWAAGSFESGALLAHWDGSKWTGVPNPVPGFDTNLHSVIKVGNELWAGGKRTIKADGSDVVIAKHSSSPCPAPGPDTPLNPPVPLPGAEKLPFATGKSIDGVFLKYWQNHGGLTQQGYPITDVLGEVSELDGKVYTVQYFERAIFEYHPELKGTGYEVLLSQLGTFQYARKYPNGAPNQRPNQDRGTLVFPETGKRVGGSFLKYWQDHGGIQQQGFPISDEFTEVSEADGKPYTVQYFERSVFEWHPENAPPYNVLLSLLGNFRYDEKYTQSAGAPPENEPRLIGSNVQSGRIEGGGHYLAWKEGTENNSVISVYDANQNERFPVTGGNYRLAGADGKQVAWLSGSNLASIYNMVGGTIFTVTVPTQKSASSVVSLGEFALNDNTLYYSYKGTSKSGILAQDLIKREDNSVALSDNAIQELKAENGLVLWTEKSASGTEASLHVWSAQARSALAPASGIGAFSGYGAWGDYVTWSFYSSMANQVTYLYNTRTSTRKVLNTGAASGPVIGNGRVAWVRWPDLGHGETGGWDIEVYDIGKGSVKTVVQGLPAMPGNLKLVDGDRLAFSADVDPGSVGYEVWLVDLGSGK